MQILSSMKDAQAKQNAKNQELFKKVDEIQNEFEQFKYTNEQSMTDFEQNCDNLR